MMAASPPRPSREIRACLRKMGFRGIDENSRWEALPGGVSSQIWKLVLADRTVCVKKALPRLKVAADWFAPVERSLYETRWLQTAESIIPGAVPRVLAVDEDKHIFVMEFLDESYVCWKRQLLEGDVWPEVAAQVGDRIGLVHASTAGCQEIASRFATDSIFASLRLEPYLEEAARVHPDRAEALHRLITTTAGTRLALVHGDVSPKNILIGPEGPVFLDAECAWFGDPAFDLAFCLNHLLLKSIRVPRVARLLLASYEELTRAYLARVNWEDPETLSRRAAHLLPGLLLARIDGKSPVEYLRTEALKERVRQAARRLLAHPVASLTQLRESCFGELQA